MRPALRQPTRLLQRRVPQPVRHSTTHTAFRSAPVALSRSGTTQPPRKKLSTCEHLQQQREAATAISAKPDSIVPPLHPDATSIPPGSLANVLPRACPGCGAPSQLIDKDEAGYYDSGRRAVRSFLSWNPVMVEEAKQESEIVSQVLKNVDPSLLGELGFGHNPAVTPSSKPASEAPQTPVCDRCHNLLHHQIGTPILHPSVDAIQQTVAESPHRRNHIYHVLDAADFPLSIVPNLQSALRIPRLRTQNRRAKHKGWVANDRIAEVSFIVTRADLLAPKKEQVDGLMPYVRDVLKDALGRANNKARMGNVRLVSAKRGWWTKQVKEDIWERGGGGWMVGKVNVGKSNLFEAVFPKGRGADYKDVRRIRSATEREAMLSNAQSLDELVAVQQQLAEEDAETERLQSQAEESNSSSPEMERSNIEEPDQQDEDLSDVDSLLPPPQPYTPYPVLPIASHLPGTTASPIRIPFGRNRGELIDLPGLARSTPGLESFVQPPSRADLVMTTRVNAPRIILKPGQSLVLGGGLLRFTPLTPDAVFILHPFLPPGLATHVTRTDKALAYASQNSERNLPTIALPHAAPAMKRAGSFPLRWDATRQLAGALTDPVAGKMKPDNLPFRVWGADILIEGVGWIEVSCQMRRSAGWKPRGNEKRDPNNLRNLKEKARQEDKERRDRKFAVLADAERRGMDPREALVEAQAAVAAVAAEQCKVAGEVEDVDIPRIEVFSPLGKYIGFRRPMCASTVAGPKIVGKRDRKARPRRSMVSVKRARKPAGG